MIVIIPARAGSKRIKNKNIKFFNGKPIIFWIIKKLKKNKKVKKIAVSSDDTKILNLCRKYGVNDLIKRSKKLSNDKTPFQKVIVDTIKKLKIIKKNKEKILDFYLKDLLLLKCENFQESKHMEKLPKSFLYFFLLF